MIAVYIFIGFTLGFLASVYFICRRHSYFERLYYVLHKDYIKVKSDLLKLESITPRRDPKTGRYIKN